jgi:hypothetical protein
VRNPTKRANARHLVEHLQLIEENNAADAKREAESKRRRQEPPQKKSTESSAQQQLDTEERPATVSAISFEAACKPTITTKNKTMVEDDVLAKVDEIMPPAFSPTRPSKTASRLTEI